MPAKSQSKKKRKYTAQMLEALVGIDKLVAMSRSNGHGGVEFMVVKITGFNRDSITARDIDESVAGDFNTTWDQLSLFQPPTMFKKSQRVFTVWNGKWDPAALNKIVDSWTTTFYQSTIVPSVQKQRKKKNTDIKEFVVQFDDDPNKYPVPAYIGVADPLQPGSWLQFPSIITGQAAQGSHAVEYACLKQEDLSKADAYLASINGEGPPEPSSSPPPPAPTSALSSASSAPAVKREGEKRKFDTIVPTPANAPLAAVKRAKMDDTPQQQHQQHHQQLQQQQQFQNQPPAHQQHQQQQQQPQPTYQQPNFPPPHSTSTVKLPSPPTDTPIDPLTHG